MGRTRRSTAALITAVVVGQAVAVGVAGGAAAALPPGNTLVSVDSDEVQGNGDSGMFGAFVDVSGDGHHVTFTSSASNLVPSDTNGTSDVFVRDLDTGTTELVSVTAGGAAGGGASNGSSISSTGRFVVFNSAAPNLVSGDTNGTLDVFVRDRQLGTTELVSVSGAEALANSLSGWGSATPDGRFIAFHSYASNLVPGDTNGAPDIFVRDRQLGTTERVSVSTAGSQATATSQMARISADGSLVFFESDAPNLVPDDTNGWRDVFVHDRNTAETSRVSLTESDGQLTSCCGASSPTISPDGRYVSFGSNSSGVVAGASGYQVYLRDRVLGTTELVSATGAGAPGNAGSTPSFMRGVSDDGRYITFSSLASNLAAGDDNSASDVFVRDLVDGTTALVSIATDGSVPNAPSGNQVISGDGSVIAFDSGATDLVVDDDNAAHDVFVRGFDVSGPPQPPIGDRIVFATDGATYPHLDLWTIAPDGTDPVQLTSDPGTENDGSWSPDATRIAYVQDSTSLRITNSDGSGGTTTVHTGVAISGTDWSDDGAHLAFSSFNGSTSGFDVSMIAPDGSGLVNLTASMVAGGSPRQEGDPAWSPDGTMVAFLSTSGATSPATQDLFVIDLTDLGAGPQQLTTDGAAKSRVEWLPDGSGITFSPSGGFLTRVDVTDHSVTTYPFSIGSSGYSWSPDGARLAYAGGPADLFVRALAGGQANITNTGLRVFYPEWHGTAVLPADTDGDGVPDADDSCVNDANPAQEDLDGDGLGDVCDDDTDGDGLDDHDEVLIHGTDPLDSDTDNDGIPDGDETNLGTDPLDDDTDNDGIPDGDETNLGTDPLDSDTDNDGIPDGDDPAPLAAQALCAGSAVATDPMPLGSSLSVCLTFGGSGFVSGGIDWGDGHSSSTTSAGAFSGSHAYTAAGVYTVTTQVTDSTGGVQVTEHVVVVFDPSAGFVTGGGWFESPAGAVVAQPTVSGPAKFGFVSQYKKGASVPAGSTQFQLQAAGLGFQSTSYEWLVISGMRAQYKGKGTLNGTDGYGFMLTATDGDLTGGDGVDRIRIKIWDASGDLVYDNQIGSANSDNPTTQVGGGSIVIHKSKR